MSFTPAQGLLARRYLPFAGFLLQAAFLLYMLASEIRMEIQRRIGRKPRKLEKGERQCH
jgi:hypothetical protein